jgi:hypothetical protein
MPGVTTGVSVSVVAGAQSGGSPDKATMFTAATAGSDGLEEDGGGTDSSDAMYHQDDDDGEDRRSATEILDTETETLV